MHGRAYNVRLSEVKFLRRMPILCPSHSGCNSFYTLNIYALSAFCGHKIYRISSLYDYVPIKGSVTNLFVTPCKGVENSMD